MPRAMRRAIGASLVVLALFAVTADASLSARELREIIAEYCDEATTSDRRDEIVITLSREQPSRNWRILQTHYEETPDRVCDLITALKHPNAWDILGCELREENLDMGRALTCLFNVAPWVEEVQEELQDTWEDADVDGEVFSTLTERYCFAQLQLSDVELFIENIEDDDRGSAARRILSYAFEFMSGASAQALQDYWRDNERMWRLQRTQFQLRGVDILGSMSGEFVPVGPNARLRGTKELTYEDLQQFQTRDHTFRVRFMVINRGEEFVLGYGAEDGYMGLHVEASTLVSPIAGAPDLVWPLREGWNEMVVRIDVSEEPGDHFVRSAQIVVNGQPAEGIYVLNGRLEDSRVYIIDGEGIVGGWELVLEEHDLHDER